MDKPVSRRAMLQASPFVIAGTIAIATTGADAAPALEALTALLREYADAAKLVGETGTRFREAQRERSTAIHAAGLHFQWPNGTFGRLGETGNAYDPDYAATLLLRYREKALAICGGDIATRREVRKAFAATSRQLRRLRPRYDAAVVSTDWPAALDADAAAFSRFIAAREAVCAYRPKTMADVAAIIRCISAVGPYPGGHNGIAVRDLAEMLTA